MHDLQPILLQRETAKPSLTLQPWIYESIPSPSSRIISQVSNPTLMISIEHVQQNVLFRGLWHYVSTVSTITRKEIQRITLRDLIVFPIPIARRSQPRRRMLSSTRPISCLKSIEPPEAPYSSQECSLADESHSRQGRC